MEPLTLLCTRKYSYWLECARVDHSCRSHSRQTDGLPLVAGDYDRYTPSILQLIEWSSERRTRRAAKLRARPRAHEIARNASSGERFDLTTAGENRGDRVVP